ncbi:MAG: site-specific integrase [Clostridia bacterium]|nr:site-specific integrase [Clostridia bacterium]
MERNKKEKIGSIYYDKKRKNWRCTYYIYEKDKQEETRKTKSFLTEQEAKDFLTSIQYQKGNELFIKNNGIPLNQLMRENIQRKLDMNVIGERSYARLMETIRVIERSTMSKKNINDITSNEIQSYLNSLKDYSNSTIKKVKEQFSQAFREAINKGYIVRNPMLEVIRPKSTQIRKPVRALEIEEQQKLTNYLINAPITDVPFKTVYLIQMYLGLRIGEALALCSTDINLHRNLITVDKTVTTDKEGKIIMKYLPKTYAGIREVPIPVFIRNEIINQMRLAEDNKDRQLFLDKNGNYVRPENANRRLRELIEKMGISMISSHSLRHTYGTRCVEAGMRAVALQRLMGHSDVAITLNTYTSVFNKYKETELEKVNNYYMNNDIVSADNLLTKNNNLIEDISRERKNTDFVNDHEER